MSITTLAVPFAWGNMFVWLWLEVLALGALILWTTNTARVIAALYFKRERVIRIDRKRGPVDFFPMNEDMRQLPPLPKLILTLIRIAITLVVALSAHGIEPAQRFTTSLPTTEVVVKTDADFTGRSFDANQTDAIQEIAARACEDVRTLSIVKFKAFISTASFSCNDGPIAGQETPLVEVIWEKDAVRRIVGGRNLPVNVEVDDRSTVVESTSNETLVQLQHSGGISSFVFLSRKIIANPTFGECTGRREYLVASNTSAAEIDTQNVAAALVICEPGSTIHMRNTDNMFFFSTPGANQQLTLARNVAESCLSIKQDTSQRVYEGGQMEVTLLTGPFNILILVLALANMFLLLVSFVLKKKVTKDLPVDIFSSFSMFSLGATLHNRGKYERKFNSFPSGDTILLLQTDGEIFQVESQF
eukprot:GFKZ01006827.1.p1 GENE.GFKZ01006827.1~~GFKZ01006827.1.p1  ORF type:complete len:417 (-),score=46.65 GFKZ01006827.1:620-1870(-)